MLFGYTSTSKSTVTALIVRGLKCIIIIRSIEFALGYSKSADYRVRVPITAVVDTLAYGSNVL